MKTLILLLLSSSLYAGEVAPKPAIIKAIYKTAKAYNVDAQHLFKIAYVESRFKQDAMRVNKNGTIDYGMFQINSVHWSTTCKQYDVMLLEGNIKCAATIIKSIKARHAKTDSFWLGRYHSNTPSLKTAYALRIRSVVGNF